MTVREIPVTPAEAAHVLHDITFIDRFEAPTSKPQSLLQIYWNIFTHSPDWITTLMNMRNRIVALFGLKGVRANEMKARVNRPCPEHVEVGQQLGVFTLLRLDEDEIVLGEDDTHLDFRVILRRSTEQSVHITTVVSTHNTLGRAYMAAIKPFHKIIARTMIQKAVKEGRI